MLGLLAGRSFISLRSHYLTQEWTDSVTQAPADHRWRNPNWANWLEWLKAKSRYVANPPHMKRIVRDAKDVPILALAIAHRANCLVSYDRDLLDLEKPYGAACVRPVDFIRAVLATV